MLKIGVRLEKEASLAREARRRLGAERDRMRASVSRTQMISPRWRAPRSRGGERVLTY
jgi:hypothetical protein